MTKIKFASVDGCFAASAGTIRLSDTIAGLSAGGRARTARMPKYGPLKEFLAKCDRSEVELSFADVEAIIGCQLPRSATRRQWWANEANQLSTHVQCLAWREAGYQAVPAITRQHVRFSRMHDITLPRGAGDHLV
jgi:hypothetical protein